jgi:multidrug efflux system membrane fusion protein
MTVTDYREYTGYIEAIKTITIRVRIRGILKSVKFQEGTDVAKGALLYEIEPAEFENSVAQAEAALAKAKADIVRAQAESEKAEAELARATKLRATNAISEEEWSTSNANSKVTQAAKTQATAVREQAEAALATAKLDLSYTKIYAPVAGRISRTMVHEGNLVGYNEATILTNLITTNPVYVMFDVPEADALDYDRTARAENRPKPTDREIPVEVGVTGEVDKKTGYPTYPHVGVIDFRENRIESGSGTVRMRGELRNDDRTLSTGMYAHVRVPRGDSESRIMVPEAAVLSDQQGRYVFTVGDDNVVVKKPVTLGPRDGTMIAVKTGLVLSDWVVVRGLQLARPKADVVPNVRVWIPFARVFVEFARPKPVVAPQNTPLPATGPHPTAPKK